MKCCLGCKFGTVIRYAPCMRRFPMGVYCDLDTLTEDDDPRDYINSCSHSCELWERREKKEVKK